jgi:hypothetical protein
MLMQGKSLKETLSSFRGRRFKRKLGSAG